MSEQKPHQGVHFFGAGHYTRARRVLKTATSFVFLSSGFVSTSTCKYRLLESAGYLLLSSRPAACGLFGSDFKSCVSCYTPRMSSPIEFPPPGFDDVSIDEQLTYVEGLLNYI